MNFKALAFDVIVKTLRAMATISELRTLQKCHILPIYLQTQENKWREYVYSKRG